MRDCFEVVTVFELNPRPSIATIATRVRADSGWHVIERHRAVLVVDQREMLEFCDF